MVLEILQKTKEILETRGWVQDAYTSPKGVCLSEAFQRAIDFHALNYTLAAYVRAKNHILDEISRENNQRFSMIRYNDQVAQTKEQVLNLLDRAIEKASS